MYKLTLIFIYGCFLLNMNSFASFVGPGNLFPTTTNKLQPSHYWLNNQKPYQTNAWFTNFVVNPGENRLSDSVNIFPYLIRTNLDGIRISYTEPVTFTDPSNPAIVSALYYQFEDQIRLGSKETMDTYGVTSSHGLQINLEWQNKQQQKVHAPIVQGSPYLTEFFTNATPQLKSRFKWLSINKQAQMIPLATSNRYELEVALDDKHTQTWILYSETPISLTWETSTEGEKLSANATYTGWIRLVLQQDTLSHVNNDSATLDTYSQTIPLDYKQHYFQTENNLIYSLSWQTQNNKPPLMLSLPHQRNSLPQQPSVTYFGMKGQMAGETQKDWNISLPLIPILFLEQKSPSVKQLNGIRQALLTEAEQLLQRPFPDDGPYWVGKRLARTARLILIANEIKEYDAQKKMLTHIKASLTQHMQNKRSWHFEYDTTWGGIIPSIDDYGARHYNDHHFHYGYWVYAFAIIGQFDPQWLNQPIAGQSFTPDSWIKNLIQDYANEDHQNPYYPIQRHQDDYAGHSWASGLTNFEDGQNQQSSSEAVNAYYSLALYAKATHDDKLFRWGQFLMTRELIAAQTYWQITKDSTIYNPQFKEHNQVVANLWANKVDSNAFFVACKAEYRCGLEYSFGIEMLPFTAISQYLFQKAWLENAYPTIEKLITGKLGTVNPIWKWILVKGIATIMDKNEKEYYFDQAMDSNPDEYDNGDSKTNTLYFLADD